MHLHCICAIIISMSALAVVFLNIIHSAIRACVVSFSFKQLCIILHPSAQFTVRLLAKSEKSSARSVNVMLCQSFLLLYCGITGCKESYKMSVESTDSKGASTVSRRPPGQYNRLAQRVAKWFYRIFWSL